MEPVTHRCPKCNALVVDRRSAVCTTCHAELPAEWQMTPQQIAEVTKIDDQAKAEHEALMSDLDSIPTDSTTSPSQPDL
jgi:hypothetical protein